MLELMAEMPIDQDLLQKMDKAAVVKLAVLYFKMKHFVQKGRLAAGQSPCWNIITMILTVIRFVNKADKKDWQ